MEQETHSTSSGQAKTCQNCKNQFAIEPDDFAFYEKIKVPPPTWCPKCRFQRRLSFFNLTTLHRRKCDLCKKEFVSEYRPDYPHPVYCTRCWWSDQWDAHTYGRNYDFNRPFFEQYAELLNDVPRLGLELEYLTSINSDYNNHAGDLKNCYLIFQADTDEDCSYGVIVKRCRSLLDCSLSTESESCFDSMHIYKTSNGIGHRSQVVETLDSAFLRDSFNCQNCFASANLRNKKYYILNKPYSKEEYFEQIKKWDLGSYKTYQEVQRMSEEHWKKYPPKPNKDDFSFNSTGSHNFQTKNCKNCFEVTGAEDSKYLFMLALPPMKDCYDLSAWGDNVSMIYEGCVNGGQAAQLRFCNNAGLGMHDAEYVTRSFGGSHLFGSVGIRNSQHVILNKRYSAEQYEDLRAQIIEHMKNMPFKDKLGRLYDYGEFFPLELSPFPYNDTVAQRFFPLTKEQAEERGFWWQELEERPYQITKKTSDLPDHIKDVQDSILKETIECEKCRKGFKVIPRELEFLRKMNVPFPRNCPWCRINEKFDQWIKNLRVIDRKCSECGIEFQTHYSEDEVKDILCKTCYQNTIV